MICSLMSLSMAALLLTYQLASHIITLGANLWFFEIQVI